jgi:predicted TIM-barrel fold metal-dependent hydrolase
MMPTYVQQGLDLGQPQFDPIYAAAQELGVPIGFHATAQVAVGNTRFHKYLGVHMTSHPFEQMLSIVSIISNGVLDRFPKLKVAFLEAGVGFLPYWMERFDEKYLKRKSEMEPLKLLPSEYIKINRCYFTCEGEESALPLVIEQFGDECMMYASDYPHWDTGGLHGELVYRKDISGQTKKILATNAKAFLLFRGVPKIAVASVIASSVTLSSTD